MNSKLFVTVAVSIALAGGAVSAKEHRLPDGTVISVIHDGTTNLARGNSLTTVVSECKGTPMVCTTAKIDTATTPGLLAGVPEALATGLGFYPAAKALRPAISQSFVDSYSGGSYAEGGSAAAVVDQSHPSYHANYFDTFYGYQVPQAPAPNPPCINCKGAPVIVVP